MNPVNLIIFSIALAVSVVPEALPLVTTFSFSQGALHLAKNKVVVKRLSAIEDLGSIEVLCIDKTGTITENQLSVDQIYPEKSKALFEATLAFNDLFPNHLPKNPFDLAIWKKLINQEKVDLSQYQKIKEIPFDPERRRDTTLIKNKVNKTYQIISRGAPETLISLCKNLTINEIKSLEKMIIKKGQEGKRVIAIAQRILGREPINLEVEEKNLNFSGLISFFDPIKKTASQAIQNAEKMGLKIIVLTGDRKEVAATVAHDIRLIYDPNDVISMEEYETFDLQKKLWAIENYRVFARVSPSQKYQIIQLLQKKYQVGFLGDGINDAPALKIANIALAADKASAIAIEASDIVLLQKDLNVIVEGIREGRKIFTNTTKYIITTLASNFGNFGAVATASLLVNFLPMLPSQILLLNLLSDFPMISIATDNVDNYELREPKKTNLRSILPLIITLGFVSSLFDFVCFAFFARSLPAILQTNWFIASILTEIVFIFSIRSKFFFLKAAPPSISLLLLAIFAALITIALPFLPIGQKVFQFHGPSISHLLIIFILVGFYFLTTETVKNLYLRIYQYKDQLINS